MTTAKSYSNNINDLCSKPQIRILNCFIDWIDFNHVDCNEQTKLIWRAKCCGERNKNQIKSTYYSNDDDDDDDHCNKDHNDKTNRNAERAEAGMELNTIRFHQDKYRNKILYYAGHKYILFYTLRLRP